MSLHVDQLAFVFGLLGNIVSFLVYLSPLPTFYRICKKRSSDGYQAIPYLVALFSATLTLYYGHLKPNGFMLVTINATGCVIEGTYIIIYFIFAPKNSKINTAKLFIMFNIIVIGSIILFTYTFSNGSRRIKIVGWICAVFSVCVYVAPLGIMKKVIKEKSVEYMPFSLSLCLTLCATTWFFYGLLVKDYFIALPNTLGFLFGISQMILYIIYMNGKKAVLPEQKVQELVAAANAGNEPAKLENGSIQTPRTPEEEATTTDKPRGVFNV